MSQISENHQSDAYRSLMQSRASEYTEKMAGRTYRHFKGNLYVVEVIAVHSETSELRVIYHSKDNPSHVWDRNLDMFLSKVDKVKYPDVKQEYRFELV